MTHPHLDPEPGAGLRSMHALYQTPIRWQVVNVHCIRSNCRTYTVAKIKAGTATFYEASAAGDGLISRNTFAQRAKAACEGHRDARMGLMKVAA